jgi:hypothetical protein
MLHWNGVDLIDGRFYILNIDSCWSSGRDNNWIFSFKDNTNNDLTLCYVSSYFGSDSISRVVRAHSYIRGRVCDNDNISSLREATNEEVHQYLHALSEFGYNYNLNTKQCRDFGIR